MLKFFRINRSSTSNKYMIAFRRFYMALIKYLKNLFLHEAFLHVMFYFKLLKSNPQYTPEMLATGKLQDLLLPRTFSNVVPIGISTMEINFTSTGDLDL
jgi:hypothetical protein